MKMLRKNFRSTRLQVNRTDAPEPTLPPPQSPRTKVHNVGVFCVDTADLKNLAAMDLTGRFPVTSARGHKYIFIMYDFDNNYINAVPIVSRKSHVLVEAFKTCYEELKAKNLTARLLRLDNEISKDLIAAIEAENLEYQLVSPGDHRLNHAERAIQTFKNHFIAILSGADPEFPKNCWDLLIPQTVITLNLARPSRINPAISAYTQVHGIFDFDKTPMAPAGCKMVIHDRPGQRSTWANHASRGFYIGPALHHYRNYRCFMVETKSERTSNTIDFFPVCCENPTISAEDTLATILLDLLNVLQTPVPSIPFLCDGTELTTAVKSLQDILGATTTTPAATATGSIASAAPPGTNTRPGPTDNAINDISTPCNWHDRPQTIQ